MSPNRNGLTDTLPLELILLLVGVSVSAALFIASWMY
jgi:hypothetical protein